MAISSTFFLILICVALLSSALCNEPLPLSALIVTNAGGAAFVVATNVPSVVKRTSNFIVNRLVLHSFVSAEYEIL
jgi:hypothetical protein